MNEKIIESWEQEFDNLLPNTVRQMYNDDIVMESDIKKLKTVVKSFISSLLSSARAEERAIYENCPQCEGLGKKMVADERARIVEVVEGMKMKYPPLKTRTVQQETLIDGYNVALNDCITELAQEEEVT